MNTILLLEPSYISAHSHVWFGALLQTSIKAALVLAAAAALGLVLRRASSAARHLWWNLALCSLLLLPVLSFIVPALQIAIPGGYAGDNPAMPDLQASEIRAATLGADIGIPVDSAARPADAGPGITAKAGRTAALATDVEPLLLQIEDQT